MNLKEYHVAYITDENYAMPTCVSIVSLFKNKPDDVAYHVYVIMEMYFSHQLIKKFVNMIHLIINIKIFINVLNLVQLIQKI